MSKTVLTPKQLFEKRNTTDVFNREVIMGLLRILNRKLVYQQVWSDENGGVQNVTVPFFYDFGGSNINSERFIQDNYTFFTSDECTDIGLKKIDGNFDFYPQGRLSLTSVNIDSGSITNRFSMGRYTKYEDGKLKTYVSYLYSMPLQFQFNLEIRCETMLTAFKIDQAIREYFYKVKTFHFNYRGTICPCRVGFPESQLGTQGSSYVTGQAPGENWIKLTLSLQCETYQPVFDPYTEHPADCSINSIGANIWVNNHKDEEEHPNRTGPIVWKTDFAGMVLVAGQDILIEWYETYMDRDLLFVDICYQAEGDDTEYLIDSIDNHHMYHLRVPEELTNNSRIDVIIPNTETVTVTSQPELTVIPDPSTHLVEPENVYVKSRGFFIAPSPNYKVPAVMSFLNKDDVIEEHGITVNLYNFMVDEMNPVDFECFAFNNTIDAKKIRLIVKDHYQKENEVVSDWITII